MIDAGLSVRAFFTTREGGVSDAPYASLNVADHVGDTAEDVGINRATVERAAGAPVTFLQAQHGARVAFIERQGTEAPAADVLVTDVPGIALATIAADCVPVLLHDAASGAVAAAHVGRAGLWIGAVDSAIAALLDLRPASASRMLISASVGPAICGKCYEVPAEMRSEMASRHPTAMSTTRWRTPAIDIPRAVESRLGELGVGQVVRKHMCTFEDESLFSHRRDGITGRQAGVVVCGVSLQGGRDGTT